MNAAAKHPADQYGYRSFFSPRIIKGDREGWQALLSKVGVTRDRKPKTFQTELSTPQPKPKTKARPIVVFAVDSHNPVQGLLMGTLNGRLRWVRQQSQKAEWLEDSFVCLNGTQEFHLSLRYPFSVNPDFDKSFIPPHASQWDLMAFEGATKTFHIDGNRLLLTVEGSNRNSGDFLHPLTHLVLGIYGIMVPVSSPQVEVFPSTETDSPGLGALLTELTALLECVQQRQAEITHSVLPGLSITGAAAPQLWLIKSLISGVCLEITAVDQGYQLRWTPNAAGSREKVAKTLTQNPAVITLIENILTLVQDLAVDEYAPVALVPLSDGEKHRLDHE